MNFEVIVKAVRESIKETLNVRSGDKTSLRSITRKFKLWERLNHLELAEVLVSIEERFPNLSKVSDSVKEELLVGVHTVQHLAVAVHHMLENVVERKE